MNNINELTAKQSDLYISDIWKKLPYGIIDKGVTGCGATTLPLESKENVIVCVPLVQLIKNKVIQYPNKRVDYTLQGVYSGITEKEINDKNMVLWKKVFRGGFYAIKSYKRYRTEN